MNGELLKLGVLESHIGQVGSTVYCKKSNIAEAFTRVNMKRISARCSSSKAIEFTTMQDMKYLGQTCPKILFSWRKEKADSIITVQVGVLFPVK